ncbi:MAG: DUF262 domain-containing protein [Rhodospirillales bacterium]|nr:DUF262 domain-containing protein [Rhodospirillales bacterium]
MDADEFKVTEVLNQSRRFVVPLYQRQYQWHDHKNYEGRTSAFWLDLAAKAAEVVEGQSRFDHYMGALLLAPPASDWSFGETPIVQVVDGQQRLTTFLILLAAIREVAREHDHSALIEQIEKYLFNELGRADTDPLARYKLTPTPVDRDVFLDILEHPYAEVRTKQSEYYWGAVVPQNTSARSLRAYEYFVAQIKEFVASGTSDDTEIDIDEESDDDAVAEEPNDEALLRLDALLEALVFHLKLIVITLGPEDDAQVIFETLNSKSQPLLAMDLVRNNIFHRAETQHRGEADARERAEALYHEIWSPFDEGWWRAPAPNARPARPRIDHFLANVLTAETGQRITVRELYAEYRAWATPNRQPRFERVEDELEVLQRHAPAYETLEHRREGDEAIMWLGDRLRLWQNTTAYPIAFQVAAEDVDSDTRWTIVKWIDSYLTRRSLCDLTPKNLNQIFPRLADTLRREGVSVESVRNFFAGMKTDTTRFPNNAAFRIGILDNRAYDRIPSRILSELLWSLELAMRTDMTEATPRPPSLWVEHVLPYHWEENWPLNGAIVEVGDIEVEGYAEREKALQTLGNLTITTSKLNQSLGNAAFEDKAPKLIEHSNLTLNRHIVEHEYWDEATIRGRGEALADLAIKIWPSLADG